MYKCYFYIFIMLSVCGCNKTEKMKHKIINLSSTKVDYSNAPQVLELVIKINNWTIVPPASVEKKVDFPTDLDIKLELFMNVKTIVFHGGFLRELPNSVNHLHNLKSITFWTDNVKNSDNILNQLYKIESLNEIMILATEEDDSRILVKNGKRIKIITAGY
jgi:hypothetical protein